MFKPRGHTRFNTDAAVFFKLKEDPARSIKAGILDLSFTGFSAYSPEKIEEGSEVGFELSTKFIARRITGECKIQYIREASIDNFAVYRIGAEFTDIDKEEIMGLISNIQREITKGIRASQVRRPPGPL